MGQSRKEHTSKVKDSSANEVKGDIDRLSLDRFGSSDSGIIMKDIFERYVLYFIIFIFILLCILSWLNEILDFPHLFMGAPQTPINYSEAIIEMVLIIIVGLFTLLILRKKLTERKRAEDKLRETSIYLNNLLEYGNAPIIVWDPESNITRFNHAFERLTGYSNDEIIGKKLQVLFPEKSRSESKRKIARTLKGEYWESVEIPILCRDGGIRIALWNSANICAKDDTMVIATIAQGVDITERKRAEKVLRESEENLRTTLNSIGDAVISTDLNGYIVGMNPVAENLTGWKSDEAEGKPLTKVFNLIDAQTRKMAFNPVKKVIENGEIVGLANHSMLIAKDGIEYQIADSGAPIRDSKGNITGVVLVFRDITERKKRQTALEESERKYREMANMLPQIVFEADLSGKLTFVNEQAYDLFGYSKDEFKQGFNLYEMTIEEDREKAKESMVRIMRGGPIGNPEYTAKRKDGSTFPVMIYLNPVIKGNKPTGLRGIVVDITERKQAEETLIESEQTYRNLIRTTSEGYWCVGPDLITIDVNDSLCDMLGYSRQKMIGRHLYDFFEEDDLKLIKEQTSKISSTKYRSYEIPMKRSNGKLLHAHFNATTLPERKGVKQGSFAFITDMTEQKELTEEILQANRELKDSQRTTLKILEDLSAENRERKIAQEEKEMEMNRAEFYLDLMSHDITNIHQGIFSWIQLAKYPQGDGKKEELDLKIGENLVKRSIDLVRKVELLSGLKRRNIIFHPFELGASIEKTIRGVEDIFVNKEIVINYKPPAEDIVIQAEPLIEQLFFNLIHNGVKFQFGDKAIIDINLSASEKDGTVRFEISDHGPGIPDEMKKNLFDRFKKKDRRFHAGIGLSLVKELVDRYNGTIEVKDRIKGDHTKGARFVVTFPLGARDS